MLGNAIGRHARLARLRELHHHLLTHGLPASTSPCARAIARFSVHHALRTVASPQSTTEPEEESFGLRKPRTPRPPRPRAEPVPDAVVSVEEAAFGLRRLGSRVARSGAEPRVPSTTAQPWLPSTDARPRLPSTNTEPWLPSAGAEPRLPYANAQPRKPSTDATQRVDPPQDPSATLFMGNLPDAADPAMIEEALTAAGYTVFGVHFREFS